MSSGRQLNGGASSRTYMSPPQATNGLSFAPAGMTPRGKRSFIARTRLHGPDRPVHLTRPANRAPTYWVFPYSGLTGFP
jgi:hypothetical protein